MINFFNSTKGLMAVYLGQAKHIICSVASLKEDFRAVLDVIYPDAALPGALIIARKMREMNEMPSVFINQDSRKKFSAITALFKTKVDFDFLEILWPQVKEIRKSLDGKEVTLGMTAFANVEMEQARPFLLKYLEDGAFHLDIGMPLLKESMRERLISTNLRCFKDGISDPGYTKILH